MRFSLSLVLVACLIGTAWAEKWGSPITGEAKTAFLVAWNERLRDLHSLHMVFTQEKHLPVLRQALTAQGELWLKGEKLLYRLTNAAGDTELVVSLEPQTVRTYYPLLHTMEVLDMQTAGALSQPLPFWSSGPEALGRDYDVELFLDSVDVYTLRLVPKDARSPLQEMHLVLRDFQPQVIEQVEKSGTRIRMHIITFVTNAEVSDAQLALRVPAGTRVVQPLK